MNNKILNIIGIIAVIIAAYFAIFKMGNTKMIPPVNFNTGALENAVPNVNSAILSARLDVEKLAAIPDKTWMNFMRPLMDIDAKLDAILSPIHHLDSVNNSDITQKILDEILPLESDYASDMSRHIGVYNGMVYIKNNSYEKLNDCQKKLLNDSIKSMEIAGIALPPEKQKQLKEISAKLSKLSNDFSNNIIAANKQNKITIRDEKLLGDMPDTDKAAARKDGGWEFSLLSPSYTPFMEYITDEKLRMEMYKSSSTRAPENEKIIPEILKLRGETANILGYTNYAEMVFEFRDAKNPIAALKYLSEISNAAHAPAVAEFAELRAFSKIDLKPWDTAFYARELKKKKYNLDESETKPYFEMRATINGTMSVISEMFDIKFVRSDKNIWDKNVQYFDLYRDGKLFAGLYLDLQTRESKSSGAWAGNFSKHYMDADNIEHLATGVVVANFPAEVFGAPSLLSLNDVSTLFHEMGHAMHLLLSKVDEMDSSGYEVDWDVVEFPSQFLESFWNNPIVLKKIGRHYQTGEIISDDLIARIIAADNFNRGLFLTRQLELGIFDMELHLAKNPDTSDVQKILDSVRQAHSVIAVPDYNKFQNTFLHIFSGGYSAGYYSYLWAESLAADAYIAFDGNPFNLALSHKYRDTVLSLGDSKPMGEIYRMFLGRDADPKSLLKFYGLK